MKWEYNSCFLTHLSDIDFEFFSMQMRTYENNWPLSNYGKKYARAFANMGNAGVTIENMVAASDHTCSKKPDV